MKTRVVEFINRLQDGGAETLIKDYALLINKDEFEVIVLCYFANKESPVYKTLIDNNIKVFELYGNYIFICRVLSRIFRKFNSILLKKYLSINKPNVIHAHLEILETLYYARDKLNSVKLFYTCHNLPNTLIGADLPNENLAIKYLIKNNNLQIIALHDEMAKEINSLLEINNTHVIKNGIDFNKFNNITINKNILRNKLSIPKDAYVIGNIGRWTFQKNPIFTLMVFNNILKINNNAYLLMIGDGKMKRKIIKYITNNNLNKRVILLSHRNDIPELLKIMDVFLFPSRYEGLGIVLIEAQVSNVRCVCSDAIPKEAFQSNLITKLSLDSPLAVWSNACLNPICNIDNYGNLNDYNINVIIKKIEKLYSSNY